MAPDPYQIHDVTVLDIPGVIGSLHPAVTKRVVFYVGTNGPFQLNYSFQQYSAAQVRADMQAQVQILREIGATPQGPS
jgi:hypothetical protein